MKEELRVECFMTFNQAWYRLTHADISSLENARKWIESNRLPGATYRIVKVLDVIQGAAKDE